MKKKIVFFHLLNDRSGSPKVLSQVVEAVIAAGHSVEIHTTASQDGFLSDLGVKIQPVFYRWSTMRAVTFAFFVFSQIQWFFKSFKYLGSNSVFYINTMLPFGPALAGFLLRIPVVYHVHETTLNPPWLKKFLKGVIGLTANRIIYVSEFLRQEEGRGTVGERVVHNGIELPSHRGFSGVGREDLFGVLMICSLKDYKGVREFVELSRISLMNRRFVFRLVLNATWSEIEHFFGGAVPAGANLKIHDRQSDVVPFYKNSHVLLSMTRPDECKETFGLTILEGMSFGLPAIVPPVGGPAEIVVDGVNGYLLSCYDLSSIKDRLEDLSEDKALYEGMASHARARAGDFSLDAFRQRVMSAIRF